MGAWPVVAPELPTLFWKAVLFECIQQRSLTAETELYSWDLGIAPQASYSSLEIILRIVHDPMHISENEMQKMMPHVFFLHWLYSQDVPITD